MKTIPQIRKRLTEIAGEITALAEETKRRPAIRRARANQAPITSIVRRQVRALVKQYPDMPMREIGRRVGIDQGRVSEIVHGFRDKR